MTENLEAGGAGFICICQLTLPIDALLLKFHLGIELDRFS